MQRALFSATMQPAIEDLVNSVLRQPVKVVVKGAASHARTVPAAPHASRAHCAHRAPLRSSVAAFVPQVVVGERNAAADTVEQRLVFCGREDGKLVALRQIVREGIRPPVLIFVQSVERAVELFHELVYDGINVDVLHAERSQAQREATVTKFRQGRVWVLIATELVARGMDFKGVSLVINYDFPQVREHALAPPRMDSRRLARVLTPPRVPSRLGGGSLRSRRPRTSTASGARAARAAPARPSPSSPRPTPSSCARSPT